MKTKHLLLSALAIVLGISPGVALAASTTTSTGFASDYPNKALRLIVPFPPGGGNDILARSVGQHLSTVIGQQVVIDNRGGAGGLVGAELAAQAVGDGYTPFLASVGNMAFNPALYEKLPYSPVKDFAPVSLLATAPFILVVNPTLPVKSVKELIALAKAKPGSLNYASAGQGSSLHLTGEIFKLATATDLVHVAYKGSAPALTDLLSGRVQVMFGTSAPVLPHIRSGKLRALGVSSAKRAAAAPDVPTIAEAGVPGFEVMNWYGIVLQARTPAAIVHKLNRDLLTTLKRPDMIAALDSQGLDAAGSTPDSFGTLIRSEIVNYAKVVKAARITAE